MFNIYYLITWWLHLMFCPFFGTCSLTLCKAGSMAPHCLPYTVWWDFVVVCIIVSLHDTLIQALVHAWVPDSYRPFCFPQPF